LWMCHQHHGCLNLPIREEALFFKHRFLPFFVIVGMARAQAWVNIHIDPQ
jgi:hypothetical protein